MCLGQGSELAWMRTPTPLTVAEVLDIFRMKTAPAFEVALSLGAILAGCDEQVHEVLRQYSESLGIAYQIRDDLDDLRSPHKDELLQRRAALDPPGPGAGEGDRGETGGRRSQAAYGLRAYSLQPLLPEVEAAAWRLLEAYKSQAIGSLIALKNANLKGLLRRVIGKMFNDFEIMGCCDDP